MAETTSASYWTRLLHRWLIEYNPLYLLSAALVLRGVSQISDSLAHTGSRYGQLGVTGISELYGWALIGGAAFLTRIGLRRPAVMLGLLLVVYQGDPTLHTETCAYLGWVGVLGSAIWLASFAGKLLALAWALHLTPSRSALAVPLLGATGFALVPHLLLTLEPGVWSAAVATWVFVLFAVGLWSERSVSSKVRLDAWGTTVLSRSLRATWWSWSLMALLHVLFWASDFDLELGLLPLIGLLLATRWIRREALVWGVVGFGLLVTSIAMPAQLWLLALMAAVVLALFARRRPVTQRKERASPAPSPYRTVAGEPPAPSFVTTFVRAGRAAQARLLTGSLLSLYVSAWTVTWSGGAWPEHRLWLDLTLVAIVLGLARAARVYQPLLGQLAVALHYGAEVGWVRAPGSPLSWGVSSVAVGFALLVVCLAFSWRYQGRAASGAAGPSPPS